MIVNLEGKTALITGSAQGIGLGCAIVMAECGANIILNDLPGNKKLMEAKEKIKGFGQKTFVIGANVFTVSGRKKVINKISKLGLDIDIFVANAYDTIQKPLMDWSEPEVDRIVEACFSSHVKLSIPIQHKMIESGKGGRIIFISSIFGIANRENSPIYDACKAALIHIAGNIALELGKYGITVNCIAPGQTDTPGERKLASKEAVMQVGRDTPAGRIIIPEEVGSLAAYLSSDLAGAITGTTIKIDSGMGLCGFTHTRKSVSKK